MIDPIRVLLADDHPVVRRGIKDLLEKQNNITVVGEAASGREVHTWAGKEAFDVALLDIRMPDGGGVELTHWFRENYPDVGIVIISAFDEPAYVVAVVEAGAHSYVLKTSPEEEIVDAIEAAARGEFRLNAALSSHIMFHLSGRHTYKPLSSREIEVLKLVSKGLTNKAIGLRLEISDRTVQGHIARICDKLKVDGRIKAVTRAITLGLIDLP